MHISGSRVLLTGASGGISQALAHALSPAMIARGYGHLSFMGSLNSKAATAQTCIYNATKFALRGFAAALRADLRNNGVEVSAIFPGFIRDAGMFADADARLPPGVGTRSPQDVARAVIDAIEHNRGEADVAPLPLRLGAAFAGLAPASLLLSAPGWEERGPPPNSPPATPANA